VNKNIKKHIKILAQKFNHSIEYEKNVLILKNDVNEIKIWEENKYGINISFNLLNKLKQVKITTERIYDFMIELFQRRNSSEDIKLNSEMILTIDDWVNEEGDFAKQQLEKLKNDLKTENIKYRQLGGNRYEAEFYNGIIILTDDLYFAASNIVEL